MDQQISNSTVTDPRPTDRIKLNVGGKLFETTVSTLQTGGPDSLLAALATRSTQDPVFIDRDPEIFSVLLSLLRSDRIPSTAQSFSKQELADEAAYFGIESHLRLATFAPPLSGIDASLVSTIRPASDGLPSTFTASAGDGSVWVAHGGQISAYDWNLTHSNSIRTHLNDITSIRRVSPDIAAVGSNSDAGLHFYDFCAARHIGSIHWTDPTDPRIYKARVSSIADSPSQVFTSFDCQHKENCILVIDKSTLQIVTEISRQSGSSAKNMVPGKLTWLPKTGVLIGTAVTSGAFGYTGYIRIWDPRAKDTVVWETSEPGSGRSSRFGDSFADVDVDVENSILFKICSKSGDLAMADMRYLGDDPWVYMKDKNPIMRFSGGGMESVIHCYKSQVFVGRQGSLEVWTKVAEEEDGLNAEGLIGEELYRRNFVDKMEDSERGIIRKIEGGGNRLFVSRENVEGIEVWESSHFSGAVSVL